MTRSPETTTVFSGSIATHLCALANLDPLLARSVEQERVEPAALRHPDERLARPVDDRRAVAEAELDLVDPLLDDRGRVDRALAHGPHRHPAAAGLVAREGRLVGEKHGSSLLGEPVGGRRSGRPTTDDDRVIAFHEVEATMPRTPGVCPSGQRERAVNPSAQPTEVRILPPHFRATDATASPTQNDVYSDPIAFSGRASER